MTGIALPGFGMDLLRHKVMQPVQGPGPRLLVIGCEHGVAVERMGLAAATAISLPCTGMLPPAVVDHALRSAGYDGVVVSGCDACDCHHRHGDRWTRERVARERQPTLRERVPRERLVLSWLKPTEAARLHNEIEAFKARLADMKPTEHSREDKT